MSPPPLSLSFSLYCSGNPSRKEFNKAYKFIPSSPQNKNKKLKILVLKLSSNIFC
jgi:ssDNA-specific exonuclease RecJ